MQKLTIKDYCGYDIKDRKDFNGYNNDNDVQKIFKCFQKLGQLEDIEEELGISLVTLFRALRSGIHIIDDGYPYNDRVNLIYSNSFPCGFKGKVGDHCVFFKDYGKTWALTKEELL